jgi:hypothetical protein
VKGRGIAHREFWPVAQARVALVKVSSTMPSSLQALIVFMLRAAVGGPI